jgi:DNA-binding transcriptional LysR family regulator
MKPPPALATPELHDLARDTPALMRLRTRQLLLVAALGDQRHLGRAAAALAISQPAASRLLQEMQQALGVRIFERGPRGMHPTPAGEVVMRFARQVLNEFSAARRALAALDAGLHGSLRVGAVPSAVPPLLAPAIARFKARYPRVEITIDVATSDRMLPKLERGEVELMLGRLLEGRDEDEHVVVPILDEAQVVVARSSHPLLLADRPPPTLAETARWPWVLQPPGTPQAGRFIAMMREAGVYQRIDITETDSTIATTALLESGDMLAVMPRSLARHYGRLGLLQELPLDLPMQVPMISLVWRRGPELSPAARALSDILMEQAQGAPAEPAARPLSPP